MDQECLSAFFFVYYESLTTLMIANEKDSAYRMYERQAAKAASYQCDRKCIYNSIMTVHVRWPCQKPAEHFVLAALFFGPFWRLSR
jgi:hypothetical protein